MRLADKSNIIMINLYHYVDKLAIGDIVEMLIIM